MGKLYETIEDGIRDWIAKQPMFFVATAPNDPAGHVNLSPKGAMETFCVLAPTRVAYVDMTGSGIETAAHLRENGRIVLMFCAFAGPPKIVRLHGRGRFVPEDAPEFSDLIAEFPANNEIRALARGAVVVEVERISDSCGFTVPKLAYAGERDQLFRYAETQRGKRGEDWATEYRRAKNAVSIDGLPGLDVHTEGGEERQAANALAGRTG